METKKIVLILTMVIGYGVNLRAMDASDTWAFVQPGARVISPMENAVSRGNVERVKSLIDQSQDKNHSIEDALHLAGRYGRVQLKVLVNPYLCRVALPPVIFPISISAYSPHYKHFFGIFFKPPSAWKLQSFLNH